jgi:N-acetylmuramoyl-L-alanine amidase CwlA
MSSIKITKKTGTANTTVLKNRKAQWIVLHYTAGTSSTAGHAASVAAMFAKASTKASADFIVDDATIVQYNPDPENRYTWAVGGSKYKTMSTSLGGKYYNQCKNSNSISIEMCSTKKNTKSLSVSDIDWSISDKTVANAVELTKYLMKKYNIDINHVIMHHHVTGKVCPQPWVLNESRLSEWKSFLSKVKAEAASTSTKTTSTTTSTTSTKTSTSYKVRVTAEALRVRKGPGTSYEVLKIIKDKGVYTIVAEKNGWGELKAGGYIMLAYTEKV